MSDEPIKLADGMTVAPQRVVENRPVSMPAAARTPRLVLPGSGSRRIGSV